MIMADPEYGASSHLSANDGATGRHSMAFVKNVHYVLTVDGDAYDRWCLIAAKQGLKSDSEVAHLLMQMFEHASSFGSPASYCSHCHGPLTLCCTKCMMHPSTSLTFTGVNITTPVASQPQSIPVSDFSAIFHEELSVGLGATVSSMPPHQGQVQTEPPGRAMTKLDMSQPAEKEKVLQPLVSKQLLPPSGDSLSPVVFQPSPAVSAVSGQMSDSGQLPDHGQSVNAHLAEPSLTSQLAESPLSGPPVQSLGSGHFLQSSPGNSRVQVTVISGQQMQSSVDSQPVASGPLPQGTMQSHLTASSRSHLCCPSESADSNQFSQSPVSGQLPNSSDISISSEREIITNTSNMLLDFAEYSAPLTNLQHPAPKKRTRRRPPRGDKPKPHVCCHCGSAFAESQNLKRHMLSHTGERPFSCKECGDAFRQSNHLKRHMLTHSHDRQLPCKVCGLTLPSFKKLAKHLQSHTDVRRYTCDKCGAAFKHPCNLKAHLASHSDSRPYACSKCNAAFKTADRLRVHERNRHGGLPYVCTKCSASFRLYTMLRKHLKRHIAQELYQCAVCNAVCSSAINLKKHMRTHSPGKQHQCMECCKAFSHSANLQKHMRTHGVERSYQCTECSAVLSSTSNLKKHMKIHSRSYQCSECTSVFKSTLNLKRHMEVHGGPLVCHVCEETFSLLEEIKKHMMSLHPGETVKTSTCEDCGKSFSARYIKQHRFLHTGEKPFVCKECGTAFALSVGLSSHMKSHSGVRNYVCPDCNAAFIKKIHLKKHMKLHSGNVLFKCEVCGVSFNSKRYLITHKQSHKEDAKPFVCEVCGKGQRTEASLQKHMRIHTGEKEYICEECGAAFTWMSGLTYHMRYHSQNRT